MSGQTTARINVSKEQKMELRVIRIVEGTARDREEGKTERKELNFSCKRRFEVFLTVQGFTLMSALAHTSCSFSCLSCPSGAGEVELLISAKASSKF